jgi:iron complex outermembrane recepter protein
MAAQPFGAPWRRSIFPVALALSVAVDSTAFSQSTTAPAGTSTTSPRDGSPSPVELSPFEVRADNDVGYQAANTTSGSRLNSRLKDTPASVSAFTPEFLSDIAATNLEEMLAHATNV